jgi:hypothetical protein
MPRQRGSAIGSFPLLLRMECSGLLLPSAKGDRIGHARWRTGTRKNAPAREHTHTRAHTDMARRTTRNLCAQRGVGLGFLARRRLLPLCARVCVRVRVRVCVYVCSPVRVASQYLRHDHTPCLSSACVHVRVCTRVCEWVWVRVHAHARGCGWMRRWVPAPASRALN